MIAMVIRDTIQLMIQRLAADVHNHCRPVNSCSSPITVPTETDGHIVSFGLSQLLYLLNLDVYRKIDTQQSSDYLSRVLSKMVGIT